MNKPRCVLLDRDGTINVECCYLSRPEQLELLPFAAEGLRKMKQLGLQLAVATNQSGLARGYFDVDQLDEIHARLTKMLREEGVELDGIFYCPHHPETLCSCRKPKAGLALQAAGQLGVALEDLIVIGDKPCDISLGTAVGATTMLVRTGYGAEVERSGTASADHVVDHLAHAAEMIAQHLAAPARNRSPDRVSGAARRQRRAG